MSIRISEKYGVNPSLSVCYYCLQEKNELVLTGRLPNDAEAPRKAVWNTEPCDECKGFMAMGIILISVRDGEDDRMDDEHREHNRHSNKQPYIPNPYRTGGWCVITEEAVRRMITTPELAEQVVKSRFAFVPDRAWDQIGLPRGDKELS